MGWARIDDSFHDHPKLIGLSLEALGLWTKCLTWAHRHHGSALVLGHIPPDLPQMFAGARGKRLAAELSSRALWDVDLDLGGWNIHDYVDYLPAAERPQSASEVSKARSAAGKRGAEARWSKARESQTDSNLPDDCMASTDGKPMPPTRPDPTVVPTELSKGAATTTRSARGTRISDDFAITDDLRSWAGENVPGMDIDFVTKKFILHFQAASGQKATMIDWPAAWKKWMLGDYKPPTKVNGRQYYGKPGERKAIY
jgi:hypothetical protein